VTNKFRATVKFLLKLGNKSVQRKGFLRNTKIIIIIIIIIIAAIGAPIIFYRIFWNNSNQTKEKNEQIEQKL
jgi:flagellar basal body-associated protein FliL